MENYIIANKTDVGQARSVNEDSMITFDSPNGRVIAVCDGMGGQAAGDVASQLACSIIRDILEDNTFASPAEAITHAIVAANQGVLHRAAQEPQLEGMGCTCVMLIIKDNEVSYGWVGDSRIYYICNHTIRQISKDQSYVQSLVDSGQITPEEAANHPQKNEIINAIGLQGMAPPTLCQLPITPEPDSVFLLCSDGLTGMVDDSRIERVVSSTDLSLQEKADKLVELANQAGGLDNITVQLVGFGAAMTSDSAVVAPVPTTKKGRAMWFWISAIVFVIGAAAGVYFGYFNKGEEKKEQVAPSEKKENVSHSTKRRNTPSTNVVPTPTPPQTIRIQNVSNKKTDKTRSQSGETKPLNGEHIGGGKKDITVSGTETDSSSSENAKKTQEEKEGEKYNNQ